MKEEESIVAAAVAAGDMHTWQWPLSKGWPHLAALQPYTTPHLLRWWRHAPTAGSANAES